MFYNDGEAHPDGWIVIDAWAMFVDDLAHVGSAHDDDGHPIDGATAAWDALPIERRRALARESLARRRADPATWPAWLAARKAELGSPP